jgi:hypothetical protein
MKIDLFVETGDLVANPRHFATYKSEPDTKTGDEFVQQVLDTMAEAAEQRSDWSACIGGLVFCYDERGLHVTTDSFLDGIPRGIARRELPIRLVILSDEGWDGVPAQFGMREGNPRLMVDGIRSTSRRFAGFTTNKGWKVLISGSEFDQVVDLYRCFRKGEDVGLTEAWGFKQEEA